MADPIWKFILANTNDDSNIGELVASDKQMQLVLNRPGSLSFKMPLNGRLSEDIEAYTTYIKAYRTGSTGTQLIWSGPIWSIDEQAHENSMSVTATGWFEVLNHRFLRYEKQYTTAIGGDIAFDLINIANGQKDGPLSVAFPDGNGTTRPTGISVGTRTDSQTRTIKYPQWHNIGQAITELSDIENGYDLEITPDDRTMNIYPSSFGSTLRRDRTIAQFGFKWGPHNLLQFSRTTDMSTLVNSQIATGKYGHALSQNLTSMGVYSLFEDIQNLSDVDNATILQAFASGEIAVKSTPRVIYQMLPHPWSSHHTHVPEPFVDYRLGDHVYVSANVAPRIIISHQSVRVYGITITIDEAGSERVSTLQVSP